MTKVFSVLFLAILLTFNCDAQIWEGKDAMFPYSNTGESVYAIDDNVAWAIGVQVNSTGTETLERNTVSRTHDSGLTWSSVSLPLDTPAVLSSIDASDYNTAWITYVEYPEGPNGDQGENVVMYTADGGLNWIQVDVPVVVFVNFIYMWNAQEGIVVSDPDDQGFEIYRTTDGGASWERILTGIETPTNEFLYSDNYAVKGDQLWFASSKGRIFHSVDKGNTWVVYDSPSTLLGVSVMNVNDGGDVFLVYNTFNGSNFLNTIFRSDKNLGQWEKVHEKASTYMYDIYPIPTSEAIISTVFATPNWITQISYDRGETWTSVSTGTKATYLSFYDPDTGYASQSNPVSDTSNTLIYRYIGSPLTGLINQRPLSGVDITVSPNPTANDLNIMVKGNSAEGYWILLNSLSGELIDKKTFESASEINYTIDMSKLPSGTYMISVANKYGVNTEKIIRQ
ncbi:MAG TPA: T9SS type A sorting domain-containing protein [Saprospiraceae bacterium]|nr:T9SS type A sorting domain-containing protein [Saprospiraceae bacterium]